MSFVDLLFPQAELEALGNRWHEPAPKRRKLDLEAGPRREQGPKQNRTAAPAGPETDRHRRFTTSCSQPRRLSSKSHGGTVKRSNSDSRPAVVVSRKATSPSADSTTTTTSAAMSFLPSFIEPSILQNYLQHLHPRDRPRYSLPNSPKPDTQSPSQEETHPIHSHQQRHDEDDESSPGALTADTRSPTPSSDCYPTPSAGIFEQLHCGPFSGLIQGLRFTEHERDMVNDLLNPDGPMHLMPDEFPNTKLKLEGEQVNALHDFYPADEGFLHKISPLAGERLAFEVEQDLKGSAKVKEAEDNDVHSSGLSPAEEKGQGENKSPAGIIMYDYSALSDDDDGELFDYEQAAGPPLATP
ncbi:hypothetical protein A1O3_10015 [Capronia epimyces CBS 606.96]|uniref:Uncharacterized protein n=1 Tax=Capronia epimyces CBS 606.96 TaxID=1182542 RepID=W9XLD5_9EURO|nr:uncharacterized protein A1O3_10015 [Capronia epimyces CBS 606.96]EXJ77786.1 hypothetical protein A1O3_10015 [Capronia epimyces CBS 606.96]